MTDNQTNDHQLYNVQEVWATWFSTDAYDVDKRLRRVFRLLPSDPRCKFCNVPFKGAGGTMARVLFRKEQSVLNPHFCNMCEEASRQFPGGAEVAMSMLFADVRGSTALSEQMSPTEFGRLINRFYTWGIKIVSEEDGLMEKLAGDAIAAFWGAGFAGPDYVRRTLTVAQKLARVMQQEEIPVGIGVHAGVAYFGSFGVEGGIMDIAAIGDEVNTAARLASKAAAGEIIASEQALQAAGWDSSGLEQRILELKGIAVPVPVRVLHGSEQPQAT